MIFIFVILLIFIFVTAGFFWMTAVTQDPEPIDIIPIAYFLITSLLIVALLLRSST